MQLSIPKTFLRYLCDRPLTTIFFLALAIRLANLALLQSRNDFFAEADSIGYWGMGAGLAKAETFWQTFLSIIDRIPLYPMLLAGVQNLFGDAPRIVAFVQAFIDASTCVLIAALGAMVSPRVKILAGIIAALSATQIILSSQILTDTLFLFFFTSMLFAGAHFLLRPTIPLVLVAGLAGGLALATRPIIILLLAATVPLIFVVSLLRNLSLGTAVIACVVFTIAAAGPITPVLLRNVIYYQSWSLTTQSSDYLAHWIVPLVKQRADGTPYQTTLDRINQNYQERREAYGLGVENNPYRLAAVTTEVARDEMKNLPISAYVEAWIEGMVVNLGAPALLSDPRVRFLPKPSYYATPGASLWDKAKAYFFNSTSLYQILLLVGLIAMVPFVVLEVFGFVILAKRLPWAAACAFGICAYYLLINGPIASAKYRLPIEPILIVLTAMSIEGLGVRFRLFDDRRNVTD